MYSYRVTDTGTGTVTYTGTGTGTVTVTITDTGTGTGPFEFSMCADSGSGKCAVVGAGVSSGAHINENPIYVFPEKGIAPPQSQFVSDLYIVTIGLPILLGKYVDQSWEYINRSRTHECEN
jgi:hypothetical protein